MNARLRDAGSSSRSGCSRPPATPAPRSARRSGSIGAARTASRGSEPATTACAAPTAAPLAHGPCLPRPGFDDDEIERSLSLGQAALPPPGRTSTWPRRAAACSPTTGSSAGSRAAWSSGPRALGARSILASPIDPRCRRGSTRSRTARTSARSRRSCWRRSSADWFAPADANGGASPFMLFVYDVAPEQAGAHPGGLPHRRHRARADGQRARQNPRFHDLLQAFGARTGVPVLVNTSFNMRGEPIVCTPRDAIEAFCSSPLDALVIGSFLLEKPHERGRSRSAMVRDRSDARDSSPSRDVAEALRVSVVVPTYRRPDLLSRCLEAVCAQTPRPGRLRGDRRRRRPQRRDPDAGRGASTRARGPAVRYLRPPGGRGPAAARNAGWRAARAESSPSPTTTPCRPGLARRRRARRSSRGWAALCGRVVVPRWPARRRGAAADRPRADDARPRDGRVRHRQRLRAAQRAARPSAASTSASTRAWREDSDLQFRLLREAGPVGRSADAVVVHPVRPERWGVSLRQQKNVFFDALLYKKHPQLYRERILPRRPGTTTRSWP